MYLADVRGHGIVILVPASGPDGENANRSSDVGAHNARPSDNSRVQSALTQSIAPRRGFERPRAPEGPPRRNLPRQSLGYRNQPFDRRHSQSSTFSGIHLPPLAKSQEPDDSVRRLVPAGPLLVAQAAGSFIVEAADSLFRTTTAPKKKRTGRGHHRDW